LITATLFFDECDAAIPLGLNGQLSSALSSICDETNRFHLLCVKEIADGRAVVELAAVPGRFSARGDSPNDFGWE
jgi:hypothetical protein